MIQRSLSVRILLFTTSPLLLTIHAPLPLLLRTRFGRFRRNNRNSQTGLVLKGALVEIMNQQTGVAISLRADYPDGFTRAV